MTLDSGKVGIGTTSPDRTLTVNGTADKPGGGSWEVFSDERLKHIKGPFTPGLTAVMQLQPVRYEYTPDNALGLRSSGEHIGFSAQAVQKIIPEAVSTNDKGYLLVNNDHAQCHSGTAKGDSGSSAAACRIGGGSRRTPIVPRVCSTRPSIPTSVI